MLLYPRSLKNPKWFSGNWKQVRPWLGQKLGGGNCVDSLKRGAVIKGLYYLTHTYTWANKIVLKLFLEKDWARLNVKPGWNKDFKYIYI